MSDSRAPGTTLDGSRDALAIRDALDEGGGSRIVVGDGPERHTGGGTTKGAVT